MSNKEVKKKIPNKQKKKQKKNKQNTQIPQTTALYIYHKIRKDIILKESFVKWICLAF